MLCPGTINNLCFVLTFFITLKYFKCDMPTYIYTNKFNQNYVFSLKMRCINEGDNECHNPVTFLYVPDNKTDTMSHSILKAT